jgi:hypothetical protein
MLWAYLKEFAGSCHQAQCISARVYLCCCLWSLLSSTHGLYQPAIAAVPAPYRRQGMNGKLWPYSERSVHSETASWATRDPGFDLQQEQQTFVTTVPKLGVRIAQPLWRVAYPKKISRRVQQKRAISHYAKRLRGVVLN